MTRTPFQTAGLALLITLAFCSSASAQSAASRVEKLTTPATTIRGEQLLRPEAVAAFYRARNAAPAWDLPGDAESIRDAILEMAKDGLDPSDYHLALIDQMLAERKNAPTAELDTDLDLVLSDAVAAMIDHLRYGRVYPKTVNPRWNVDPREGAPPLDQAIARVAEAATPAEWIEQDKLDHFIYRGLKEELARLAAARAAGGWRAIAAKKGTEPGGSDPSIPAVRARLRVTGELPADASPADSLSYDEALQEAVKLFQERHRLEADAIIDKGTLEALSVPVEQRMAQVRANLERARWVLPGLGGDLMLVNIPAFKAYLIRGNRNVWEARTQIGKEARQTPSFRSHLKYAIFNPTWTVPKTILAEDVLDGMRRGENVIAEKQLRILDGQGNDVDPGSIDWASATPDNFPYTLRQDAGPDNVLGRIKFMFPNPYDVYLHDTPSQEQFDAEKRMFSSGCIRVEDAIGLAEQLLGHEGYDRAKILRTIEAGETKQVDFTPVPILIVYWTVSVGASGQVRYAPDVYDLDAPLDRALDVAQSSGATAAR